MEAEEKKKEQEEKDGFQLVQVPTQTAPAVKKPDGEAMSMEEAIVELLNGQQELKKAIVG